MRTRIRTDAQPQRDEQLCDHAHAARLAVRSGEVDRGELLLGRAEVLQEDGDALQRRGAARPGRQADAGLHVDVRVEPGQRTEAGAIGHVWSFGASSTFTASSAPGTHSMSPTTRPAARTSSIAAPSAASRSGVSCTTTRVTGFARDTFCSDFSLRIAPSTSP